MSLNEFLAHNVRKYQIGLFLWENAFSGTHTLALDNPRAAGLIAAALTVSMHP